MSKVYTVIGYDYDHSSFRGVFSSKEKAQEVVTFESGRSSLYWEIIETVIDERYDDESCYY